MASKKSVRNVLDYLKTGKIVGSMPGLSQLKSPTASTALKYRSYNPSLSKEDFISILPDNLFGVPGHVSASSDFQLIKCRDPKYFQFKDQYVLLFKDHKSMKEYQTATELGRINKVRVKFDALPTGHSSEHIYSRYVANLSAAFESPKRYYEMTKKKIPFESWNFNLIELQQKIGLIEKRSALVWNLPLEMKPHDLMENFWFYDIKHCFKIYWDDATGKTLYYVAFNDVNDCMKFKRNYHGVRYEDDLHMKLLVETLK